VVNQHIIFYNKYRGGEMKTIDIILSSQTLNSLPTLIVIKVIEELRKMELIKE